MCIMDDKSFSHVSLIQLVLHPGHGFSNFEIDTGEVGNSVICYKQVESVCWRTSAIKD